MLVSTRTVWTLSYANDMELVAADVASLVGSVAALANDLFAKDGSGSNRTWIDSCHACRTRTNSCRAHTRCYVREVYKQLGPLYFRRAHRMKFSTFKRLANELRPYILQGAGQKGGDTSRRHVPNGHISPDVQLACATIRCFAGGSPYDMMTTYGISHTETLNSYWYIVDTVNTHPKSCRKVKSLFIHEPTVGRYPLDGSLVPCGSSPPHYEYRGSTYNRSAIFNGGVPLVAAATADDGDVIPQQLIDGGNHFDDLGGINDCYNYASETNRVHLPHDQLHSYIASIGVTRPTPLSR
jgi:hypothetical protein